MLSIKNNVQTFNKKAYTQGQNNVCQIKNNSYDTVSFNLKDKTFKKEPISFGAMIVDDVAILAYFALAAGTFALQGLFKNNIKKAYTQAAIVTDENIKSGLENTVINNSSRSLSFDPLLDERLQENPISLFKYLNLTSKYMRSKLDNYENPLHKERALDYIRKANALKEVLIAENPELYVNIYTQGKISRKFTENDIKQAFIKADQLSSKENITKMANQLADLKSYKLFRTNPKAPELQQMFKLIKHKEFLSPVITQSLEIIEEKQAKEKDNLELKKLGISLKYLNLLQICNESNSKINSFSPEERKELGEEILGWAEKGCDFFEKFNALPKKVRDELVQNPAKAFKSKTTQDLANNLCFSLGIDKNNVEAQKHIYETFKTLDDVGIHKLDPNCVIQWKASLLEKESTAEMLKNNEYDITALQGILLISKAFLDVTKDDAKVITKIRRVTTDLGLGVAKVGTAPTTSAIHWGTAAAAFNSAATYGATVGTALGPAGSAVGALTFGMLAGGTSLLTTNNIENLGWDYMEKLLKGELIKHPHFDNIEKSESLMISDEREEQDVAGWIKAVSAFAPDVINVDFKEMQKYTTDIITGQNTVYNLAKSYSTDESVIQNWVNKTIFAISAHDMKKY